MEETCTVAFSETVVSNELIKSQLSNQGHDKKRLLRSGEGALFVLEAATSLNFKRTKTSLIFKRTLKVKKLTSTVKSFKYFQIWLTEYSGATGNIRKHSLTTFSLTVCAIKANLKVGMSSKLCQTNPKRSVN